MIYLDHNSATRPCAAALERMGPYLQEHWGASFAPHRMGSELIASLDARYQAIYDLAGAEPKDTFVFTSSGAEAVNQVLWSVFQEVSRKEGKCHFIASCIEDAPTMQMLKRLEELGCYVKIAPLNSRGEIDVEKLAALINPRTALITATLAHGLTGVIQPVEEITLLAKEKNVRIHIDANYALGKTYFSFSGLGADYCTFSGDRLHALKGSGGLFAREGAPLVPLILGGSEQGGLRGGAFDISAFMALSAAASQAALYLDAMSLETARLRDLFETEIQRRVTGARPLFQEAGRLPNTSAIVFPRAHQEALLYLLNRKGVLATFGGSYCQHVGRVVAASGVPEEEAECALSFSLSRMTTEEEILRAASIISEAAFHFQTCSEALFPCR